MHVAFAVAISGLVGQHLQDHTVLAVLPHLKHATVDASELARNGSILAPSLSRIIKTRESNGMISTHRDPNDGRRALISLTDKAEAFINEVAPESAAIYAELEKRIGKAAIADVMRSLDALLAALGTKGQGLV